jgi:hypothetical protein
MTGFATTGGAATGGATTGGATTGGATTGIDGPAPADARPHRRWPVWQIAGVYMFFFAVASASVVQIDRDVMRAVVHFAAVHATPPPSK